MATIFEREQKAKKCMRTKMPRANVAATAPFYQMKNVAKWAPTSTMLIFAPPPSKIRRKRKETHDREKKSKHTKCTTAYFATNVKGKINSFKGKSKGKAFFTVILCEWHLFYTYTHQNFLVAK
jgi:hypothetical protein